jgi:BASS family bile acid:Na+ symporter
MLPIALCVGFFFYSFLTQFAVIIPYLISVMLFITYCKISIREIHFTRLHFWLLAIQMVGSSLIFGALAWLNPVVAQGAMICVLAPTAISAAVITGMLGGDVASLTAYSFLSNLSVAIVAPVLFSLVGVHHNVSFFDSFIYIIKGIFPLLFLPFLLAQIAEKVLPSFHALVKKRQSVSFYLWAVSLTIVVAKTISFIRAQPASSYRTDLWLALVSLLICLGQFLLGRRIGARYGSTITGGQSLGQKNTVLSIWMAQTYLDPISSVAPGTYVLWQNTVNSVQLWLKNRKVK